MLMVHECGLKGQENILGGRVQGLLLPDFKRERERKDGELGVPFFPIHILSRRSASSP